MKTQVQKTTTDERGVFHLFMLPIRWPRALWRAYNSPYYVTFLTPQRARGVEFLLFRNKIVGSHANVLPLIYYLISLFPRSHLIFHSILMV
jgi:hypothetical protein